MMQKVEQWAIESEADEIRLEVMAFNDDAQKLYDFIGFETQSRILSKSIT